jgi:hypothetical protein
MEIKQLKYIIIGTILIFELGGLLACKKDSAKGISALDRPVVQAYLVPGTKTQVKVYYQKYLDDTITYGYPVTGLKLNISDGATTVQLSETAPGTYLWSDTTFIKENKTYTLNFDYNGTPVSAKTTVPQKPVGFKVSDTLQYVQTRSLGMPTTAQTFTSVTFSWNNSASWYYMMMLKDISSNKSPVNLNNTDLYHDSEISLGQVSTYITQQRTFSYYGNYKVLLFHVNKEYIDALTTSSTTSLNLTNPLTNVVNGLGLFTAMQADTLNLKVVIQ